LFKDGSDSTKLKAFVEHIAEIVSSTSDKVLVFCQWRKMLDMMGSVLRSMGQEHLRLDGSMKLDERVEVINKFTVQDEPRVLLCSLHAVAYGLNLNMANHVILMDPWV
jgi:SNF2 family DNA or RNA helicase